MENELQIPWRRKFEDKRIEDTTKSFYYAHEKYQALISDEYEIIDSQEYLETEKMRIDNFSRTLEEWLRSVESQPNTKVQISEVQPTDSASNIEAISWVN